jgi:hypothetical protein
MGSCRGGYVLRLGVPGSSYCDSSFYRLFAWSLLCTCTRTPNAQHTSHRIASHRIASHHLLFFLLLFSSYCPIHFYFVPTTAEPFSLVVVVRVVVPDFLAGTHTSTHARTPSCAFVVPHSVSRGAIAIETPEQRTSGTFR